MWGGAYTKEQSLTSLPKLFSVCDAFPDKLFVVAAGNYLDDVTEARKSLRNAWPSNLLMIAEWEGKAGQPVNSVWGADIYVDNGSLGLGRGSSFSTPVISALASVLVNQGMNLKEVRAKLYSFCPSITYKDYDPKAKGLVDREINLFNLEKVRLD